LALVGLCIGLFFRVFGITNLEVFAAPFSFFGDALFVEALLVHCAEDGWACLTGGPMHRLGAPFTANWSDFPRSEDFLYWVLSRGWGHEAVGWMVNTALLVAACTSATTFFWFARTKRIPVSIALVLSLCFAFSPFFFTRNQQHLQVTFYALIPVSWWLLNQLKRRRFRFWEGVVSVVLGMQFVYYAFYHVVGLFTVALWVCRRREALRLVAASFALTLCGVCATNVDTLRLRWEEGPNARALVRSARDATAFALWPEQLLIPSPFHRIGWVRERVKPYAERMGARGEYPSAYLGTAGMAGLGLVGFFGLRHFKRKKRPTLEGAYALALGAVALPKVGLLALFAQVTGWAFLRSNNRVSIVLLSLALLTLGHALRGLVRRGTRWAAIATGALGLCFWEQIPQTDIDLDAGFFEARAAHFADVRSFSQRLEAAGLHDAFVYPHGDFPEDPTSPLRDAYLPLQLYVASTHLKLSYGAVKGRPPSEWSRRTAALDDGALLPALRESGFSVVISHRAACDEACRARFNRLFGGPPRFESTSGYLAWPLANR
jgi:hypothetical protein